MNPARTISATSDAARPPAADESAAAASEEGRVTNAHLVAIAYIETHLFAPMTVKSIADHAGFSPSRFSRGFTRIQGESVMAYVRGRRLEGAMQRILMEPRVRIVDLAFDCGFDSQEAFTENDLALLWLQECTPAPPVPGSRGLPHVPGARATFEFRKQAYAALVC